MIVRNDAFMCSTEDEGLGVLIGSGGQTLTSRGTTEIIIDRRSVHVSRCFRSGISSDS